MRKYDLCMIDMDDTLFDYNLTERKSIKAAAKDVGIELDEDGIQAYRRINLSLWLKNELGEVSVDRLRILRFEMLFKELGLKGDPELINTCYTNRLSFDGSLIPGAAEFCRKVKKMGYIICIVTNGLHTNQISRLKLSGISEYINEIVTSQEAEAAKPYSEIFAYAMEKCGFNDKSRTVMIGDRLVADILGGNNFGVDTIWFNHMGQKPKKDIIPTAEAKSYEELLKLL